MCLERCSSAPQDFPNCPAYEPAYGNVPHHRQRPAAPAHCLLTPKSHAGHARLLVSGKSCAALQTFTCSMETPGQGLQRNGRDMSRARAKRQGRCAISGVGQCPPAHLQQERVQKQRQQGDVCPQQLRPEQQMGHP